MDVSLGDTHQRAFLRDRTPARGHFLAPLPPEGSEHDVHPPGIGRGTLSLAGARCSSPARGIGSPGLDVCANRARGRLRDPPRPLRNRGPDRQARPCALVQRFRAVLLPRVSVPSSMADAAAPYPRCGHTDAVRPPLVHAAGDLPVGTGPVGAHRLCLLRHHVGEDVHPDHGHGRLPRHLAPTHHAFGVDRATAPRLYRGQETPAGRR